MIVRLTADKPGKITFHATMNSEQSGDSKTENGKLILSGITADHEGEKGPIRFESQVKVIADGGNASLQNNGWLVKNANSATVYVSIATNFKNYKDVSGN